MLLWGFFSAAFKKGREINPSRNISVCGQAKYNCCLFYMSTVTERFALEILVQPIPSVNNRVASHMQKHDEERTFCHTFPEPA